MSLKREFFLHVFIGKQAEEKTFQGSGRLVSCCWLMVVIGFPRSMVKLSRRKATTSVSPETIIQNLKKNDIKKGEKRPVKTPGKRLMALYSFNKKRTQRDRSQSFRATSNKKTKKKKPTLRQGQKKSFVPVFPAPYFQFQIIHHQVQFHFLHPVSH